MPGTRYEDWPVGDPSGRGVDDVRPIRDEIEQRVRRLLADLGVPVTGDVATTQAVTPDVDS